MPVVMRAKNKNISHVIGNWKMHGSYEHIHGFVSELTKIGCPSWSSFIDAAICPPAIYLAKMADEAKRLGWLKIGAQDVSEYEPGAYTGQIAASMLADNHCRYVIVGHSERRQFCHETNAVVAKKFVATKKAGLIPILCVGETLEEREKDLTESVILSQMKFLLENEGVEVFKHSLIAYEPIWAIGTGKTATPEQAQAVHHLLRATLGEYDATLAQDLPILYGGSVKPSNAEALFAMPDIDGALVGGASLLATDFIALCEAGAKHSMKSKG